MKHLVALALLVALVIVGCGPRWVAPTIDPDRTFKPRLNPAPVAKMTCWELQGLFDISGDNWDTTKDSFWIDEMDRWDRQMERQGCYN